jgi:hypothetical protein
MIDLNHTDPVHGLARLLRSIVYKFYIPREGEGEYDENLK